MKNIKPIYAILILTAIFGAVGIFYNYGMLTGGTDETLKINSTLKFFKDFNLFDKYSTFLPVTIILVIPFVSAILLGYLAFGIGGAGDLERLAITEAYKFTPYFRFINVIFGLIAIYIFYKICFLIFKKERAAFIASYFFATSLLFVEQIHIAGAWVEQTAALLIAFYYFLKLLEKPKWGVKEYVISALLIVLNTEIEAIGFLAIVPFFIVYLKNYKERFLKEAEFGGKIINILKFYCLKILKDAGLLVFLMTVFLGVAFFSYFQPATFNTYFSLIIKAKNLGLNGTVEGLGIYDRLFGFLEIFISFEPLLLIFALAGFLTILFSEFMKDKNMRFFAALFAVFFLAYYTALGPVMGAVAERRALPLIPVLVFFAVVFIEYMLSREQNKNLKKIIFVTLALFLINPIIFDYNLLKPSSYVSARKFVYKNISANAKILDECSLEMNENKEMLEFIRLTAPDYFTTKRNYLFLHSEILERQKNFFIVSERGVEEKIDKRNFEYLVVCGFDRQKDEVAAILNKFSSIKKEKIFDTAEIYNQDFTVDIRSFADYSILNNSGIFRLFNISYHGPRIQIFKLKPLF